ncbi:IucA/IucC family C-terminal-domain containing protein [Shewanella algidipiscicola]|nr:IucA/IucC family C-terminal-domain containing protein [Shewanella algidipiscicola]
MEIDSEVFELLGIGPFNLGLAALSEPIDGFNCFLLDAKTSFDWHPDMLLKSSSLYNPFMSDLVTIAALLNTDHEDKTLISALIMASGLPAKEWLSRYLNLYLSPLLPAFFAYELVFMPHGENLILVLDEYVPVKILMKDIGEEVAVLNGAKPLPEDVKRLAVSLEEEMKLNYILLDIFDCIFRYLAPLLDEQTSVSESQFWELVADNVRDYQAQHPHLAAKFVQYDLFKDSFVRTCLNRIQLNNNQQMIDLADREKNLRFAGGIDNPLAAFRQSHAFKRPMLDSAEPKTR